MFDSEMEFTLALCQCNFVLYEILNVFNSPTTSLLDEMNSQ
jgi:hypothetical protein